MFARKVSLRLRPGSAVEFSRIVDQKVVPALRGQKGFRDQISFVSAERGEAVSLSFWDRRESAEAYHQGLYPALLESLDGVIDGTPEVRTFAVGNSTVHQIPNLPA